MSDSSSSNDKNSAVQQHKRGWGLSVWTSHQHTEEKMDIKRKDSAVGQVTDKGDAMVQKDNSSGLEIRNQQKPYGRRH